MINKPIHLFIFIFFNFLICQKSYDDIQLEIRDNNKKLVNLETSIKKLEDDIDAMKNSKFDLSWFLTVLRKNKGILFQVVIASFFVQLLALFNPFFSDEIYITINL